MPRPLRVLLLVLASHSALACASKTVERIEGRTMGTTYRVTLVTTGPGVPEGLPEAIDRRLEEINRQLSTWDDESEISRFNRLRKVGEAFRISTDFLRVMKAADEVFALSEGAWDATVEPLVRLWGFGPSPRSGAPPSPEQLARVLADVGFDKVEIREGALVKRHPSVAVDLSSIAKGYGVDAVVALLRARGLRDFLVEIGGEVYASGARVDGRPWRVGINRPDPEAGPDEVYRVVSLGSGALATSGDYRRYFAESGARRSHVIDPRTGRPVANGVVSVTVLAPSCMLADGLATAVMVMGRQAGLALVERLDGVEALVIAASPDGRLSDQASSGFRTEDPSG